MVFSGPSMCTLSFMTSLWQRAPVLIGLTLGLSLGGCAHAVLDRDRGERDAQAELDSAADASGLPPSATVSLDRERFRWAAQDWAAGRIERLGPDFVVLTPFLGAERALTMELPPETVVFVGNNRITALELAQGENVRANYASHGSEPRVVSVEILTPSQAARLQRP